MWQQQHSTSQHRGMRETSYTEATTTIATACACKKVSDSGSSKIGKNWCWKQLREKCKRRKLLQLATTSIERFASAHVNKLYSCVACPLVQLRRCYMRFVAMRDQSIVTWQQWQLVLSKCCSRNGLNKFVDCTRCFQSLFALLPPHILHIFQNYFYCALTFMSLIFFVNLSWLCVCGSNMLPAVAPNF